MCYYFLVYGTGPIVWTFQCCGSEFFPSWIPDLKNFLHPGYRIGIKEFKYFNTIKWFLSSRKYDPVCSSRIRILTFYPSRIQGSKRHRIPDLDPKHWNFLKDLIWKEKTCKFSHKRRHNSPMHNTYILKNSHLTLVHYVYALITILVGKKTYLRMDFRISWYLP
jgi:hypothetical protein